VEPRRPFDPLRPIEPFPSPLRPQGQHAPPRDDEMARLLRDILDRLVSMETRLKNIEDLLRSRK